MSDAHHWLYRFASCPDPSLRVICFPYAGGNAAMVRTWQQALGSGVDVVGVMPPGRASRIREPLIDNMEELQRCVLPIVLDQMDIPVVLFGYSIGALVAYELATRLERAGSPAAMLVAAAALPPQVQRERAARHLGDEAFLQYLVSLEGMPPEVVSSPELVEFLLPMLRADITLGETYESGLQKLSIPIATINGTRDRHVHRPGIERWRELTVRGHSPQWLEGGHFFVRTQEAAFLDCLADCLKRLDHASHVEPSASRF